MFRKLEDFKYKFLYFKTHFKFSQELFDLNKESMQSL